MYEHVLTCCSRPDLGRPWSFVDVDPDAGVLDIEPQALLVSLRSEFGDDALVKAKTVIRTDETVDLNPVLVTENRTLVVLRDSNGRASDIMTSAGTLKHRVPLFAVVQDHFTQKMLGAKDARLYAVSSAAEFVLFRSLKLPATLTKGLDRLSAFGLEMLLQLLDGAGNEQLSTRGLDGKLVRESECDASRRAIAEVPGFTLVLVAYNLIAGEKRIPANVFSVARRLAGAAHYLDLEWETPLVWWPGDKDRRDLEFRRQIRSAGLVWWFFKNLKSFYEIDQFTSPSHLPTRNDSLAVSEQKLLTAQRNARLGQGGEYRQRKYEESFDEFVESIDRQFTKPLLKSAEASENLAVRALRLQLATVGRASLMAMPSLQAAIEDRLRSNPAADGGFLPKETWEDMKALSNQMLQIIREETYMFKK